MEPHLIPTVGLEIHVRLATGRKLFCPCAYTFAATPNSQVCPVCLGLPGSLPVLDETAVDLALRAGLALGCRPNQVSEFARKNYFYPDLPRNYQITQYDRPLLTGGYLALPAEEGAVVGLRRIHLEEDAGRSLADPAGSAAAATTRVDCNRAGTPLMEIVTEPDLDGGDQARRWLRLLLQTLEYLDVCDGNLAEGSLRCDANVGLRMPDQIMADRPFSEIKNLNSFRAIGQAVDHEIERLATELAAGRTPRAQTRSWDGAAGRTRFLRFKEQTQDYRYLPEPDLPQLRLSAQRIIRCSGDRPELPVARRSRLEKEYGLSREDSRTICRTRSRADFFEATAIKLIARSENGPRAGKLAGSWMVGPVLPEIEKQGMAGFSGRVSPADLAELLDHLQRETITAKVAGSIFEALAGGSEKRSVARMIQEDNLALIRDPDKIRKWCRQVLDDHPMQVDAYQQGKTQVLEFLVGEVLGRSQGRAHPDLVRKTLIAEIPG